MNYIKYVLSKDNTKLYTKINEVEKAKANIIIVHGLAEHLDRYDEITSYLNENEFNVIRYDQRGHGRSEGKQTFYSNKDEIVEDLSAVIDKVKENYEGKIYLIGHSMGGYTVTLFGTQHPNEVSGIITSGALTRYNKKLFGEVDKQIDMNSYFDNVLSEGLCSDQEVVEKYALDDLNAKQISMGLVSTLIEGVKYLKENASKFIDSTLILHGKEDGLVSYKDSLQLFDEIGSEHKSIHIYDGLQHEIFNESSFNKSIFKEIVDWLDNEMQLS
ncbi:MULTISPECIES: alpha/beta hydrolase [Staphylococcus cohnii species complex]|uniref:alpha/beta hydrolase n=1 Tax=Staphylococcus cohnii species complex TaxID=3239053 RepID=UPI000D1C488D|nr:MULTISPECIES: alpha/beta hydrolase [Staphylococcus]MDU0461280.1 lysophospholipase [Staphylococcus ureilyticus]PTF26800.1 lysophospholipase [Staphylococcus cohnii]